LNAPDRIAGETMEFTADQFVEKLNQLRPLRDVEHYRGMEADASDLFIGVRMGQIFALAKEQMNMAPSRDRGAPREPDP
jgi:hypothetical protein